MSRKGWDAEFRGIWGMGEKENGGSRRKWGVRKILSDESWRSGGHFIGCKSRSNIKIGCV